MSIQAVTSDPSHFPQWSFLPTGGNPLDWLMGYFGKRHGCPVYQGAVAQLTAVVAMLAVHLTAPNQTRTQKLQKLPGVGVGVPPRPCDWAVHSVIALAVLSRFDLEFQMELERRGYHRSYYDLTGIDLLKEIGTRVNADDDDRLVALIANEAGYFLHFVDDRAELEAAIRDRLDDIKSLV